MKAITTTNPAQIAVMNDVMQQAGHMANEAAARGTFADHTARKAKNTIRRKKADLLLFETYLNACQVPAAGLYNHPEAWRGVSWGIVEGFKLWMLKAGYAIGSINGRLSTVRTYAKLAAKAGAITPQESILIASVQGYANKEAKHIDAKRAADGMQTRQLTKSGKARKKAAAVIIPADVAETLKQPATDKEGKATPQGKRDALLMCLFLDHGLRVGEIAALTRKAFEAGKITFYRPKVNKTQTHELTADTRNAAREYLKLAPAEGIIWRRSCKGTGKLSSPMSETSAERALTKRVELLGRHAGIEGLSAHDTRHYWATFEANHNTPVNRLMDAGGWNSPAMPLRYIEAAHIANEGTARIKA